MEEEFAEIYIKSLGFARNNQQMIGDKNDFYITLQQLEAILQAVLTKN